MDYTYEDKINQKDRIEKLNNKLKYLKVLKIIIKNNKNIILSYNDNGTFLFYHNLKLNTYVEIENYLKSFKKIVIDTTLQEYKNYSNNVFYKDNDIFSKNKKIKYSILEKKILLSRIRDNQLKN